MNNLKNTKTAENLMKAFVGESGARNKYDMFAKKAEQEGYVQISEFFKKTADNEKAHSKVFYDFLVQGFNGELPTIIDIQANYSVHDGNTLQNLQESANSEDKESIEIYPFFAKTASDEGFTEIADAFTLISDIESHHKQRFLDLAYNLANNLVFHKDEPVIWICSNCGHHHEGNDALDPCPVCGVPKDYAKILVKNY